MNILINGLHNFLINGLKSSCALRGKTEHLYGAITAGRAKYLILKTLPLAINLN